jgi:hypothetical protein
MISSPELLQQRIDQLTDRFLDVLSDPQKTAEDGHALLVAVHAAEDEQRELRRRLQDGASPSTPLHS